MEISVPIAMPHTITIPICARLLAPGPAAASKGTAPAIAAPVVIRIGRKFRDEDAMFGDHANKRHQRNRSIGIERAVHQEEPGKAANQRKWGGREDDGRVAETLELCSQQEEDDQDRERKNRNR